MKRTEGRPYSAPRAKTKTAAKLAHRGFKLADRLELTGDETSARVMREICDELQDTDAELHRLMRENDYNAARAPDVDGALSAALRYGGTDGDHHKRWVIDQMVRALTGKGYAAWVKRARAGEDGPETYDWDIGTPP